MEKLYLQLLLDLANLHNAPPTDSPLAPAGNRYRKREDNIVQEERVHWTQQFTLIYNALLYAIMYLLIIQIIE